MPHQLEYIVKDAIMMCDKGVLPMPFQPTYNTHVKMSGMVVATALDKQPIVNIPCFGACSMTGGQPCVPAPLMWLDTYKVKVKGQQTLLYKSKLPCSLGGQIEFLTSGQIPLPAEEYDSLLEEHGEETGGGWGWWDTAELIPVIGNVIGMVREAKKGNWGMVALNAAFLVVDVVTFGAGAAVTTPLKGGIKAAVKVGAKKGLQKATQTATKLGTKAGTKQLTKAGAKSFGKAVAKRVDEIAIKHAKVCVFACFPAGTKVAVKGGNKAIEEVRAGDQVWAYDEEHGNTELKRVVNTMQRKVDATVKIVLEQEEIETTAEHPFYTQAGWKDAADLSSNDRLRTREGRWQRIKEVSFAYEQKKVYNFEVADLHTYFVGAWQWLVHNATKCLSESFEAALKDAKKWADKARVELRAALELTDGLIQAHHVVPLEILHKIDTVQEAFRKGFKFNGVVNGKALHVYNHLFTNGSFYPHHSTYTKMVKTKIMALAEEFPKMSPEKLLEEKVLPELQSFLDEALESGSTINDLAKAKGY